MTPGSVVPEARRYDTSLIAERERFAFWQDTVGALFPPADVCQTGSLPFFGRISRLDLGTLAVAEIRSVAQRVKRAQHHIGRYAEDVFEVNFQITGRGFVSQDGREAVTTAGQFVLYDSTKPYEMRFDGPFKQLTVKLPRSLLKDRLWNANRLTAVDFSWRAGAGQLAFIFMRALGRLASASDTETITRLQEHGLDVLATALRDADAARRAPDASPARQAQLAHLQAFILRHLGDPALSAQVIADANGLSVRTVYGLFAAEASTPGKWLQAARLEASRRDLADPRQAGRSITDIAFARGFNDAAHFSRVFRAKFGASPRAWSAANRQK
jgi:AraC-like DNA-binding protein